MKLQYFGSVDSNGTLTITNKNGFLSDLRDFIGKQVKIIIEPKAKRSHPQNRYFHGCVIPIVKAHLLDSGWIEAKSNEWVKNYIKYNCLIIEQENETTGEIIKTLGETSILTTTEFNDFIAEVQRWGAEVLGLYIPDPGEQIDLNF